MKKKTVLLTIGVCCLLVAALGFYLFMMLGEPSTPSAGYDKPSVRVVDVDHISRNPEQYSGFLGVKGKVAKIDQATSTFLLGCQDACVTIPVKYQGQMPVRNRDITAYGEIQKQQDGRYLFLAQELKRE